MGETFMKRYEYKNLEILIDRVGLEKVIDSIAKICFQKSLIPAFESDAWQNAQSYLTEVAGNGVVKAVGPILLSKSERTTKKKHCMSGSFE
jgi:hypothetical protein